VRLSSTLIVTGCASEEFISSPGLKGSDTIATTKSSGTRATMTATHFAAMLRGFADRVEWLPVASHRSPEEPFMAREELARDMRRTAAAATAFVATRVNALPPVRARRRPSRHVIMVAGRAILVQRRRAAFAL
jgi:hypothetical protein